MKAFSGIAILVLAIIGLTVTSSLIAARTGINQETVMLLIMAPISLVAARMRKKKASKVTDNNAAITTGEARR